MVNVMEAEMSVMSPKFEDLGVENKGFLSKDEVVVMFDRVEGGKGREDIHEMLGWYRWCYPERVSSDELRQVVMYTDFGKDTIWGRLTEGGKSRRLVDVAKRYLSMKSEGVLSEDFVNKVEDMKEILILKKDLGPVFLLDKPMEYFNGQVVDGAHRLLASMVADLGGETVSLNICKGFEKNRVVGIKRRLGNILKGRQ